MITTGVDLIAIPRIEAALARWGERFLQRVLTPAEIAFCRGRANEVAVRFAAKEAVSKALGVGIFGRDGIQWQEVEILPDRRGKPLVYLHGRALARAKQLGLTEFALSLSHEQDSGVAFVVAQGPGPTETVEEDPAGWYPKITAWLAEWTARGERPPGPPPG